MPRDLTAKIGWGTFRFIWKFNIKTRRGFGFYSEQPGVAHNAFYQVKCADPAWEPLVAAWSQFFLVGIPTYDPFAEFN